MKSTLIALLSLFILQVNAQNIGDYQSAASGDWTNVPSARWDVWDGDSWENAVTAPDASSGVITILAGHNITVGLAPVTADQVSVQSGGTLTINNSLTIDDGIGIDLDVDGLLLLNSSLLAGTGSPTAQVDGTMDWSGGTDALPTVVSATGTLNIIGANKTLATILENNGSINWSASQVTFNNGTLNNNSVFNATTASSFNHAGTTNIFNNNSGATFTKSVNAGNTTLNIPVNNAGSININSGSIISTSVNGSFTSSGPVHFGGGIGLTLSGSQAVNQLNTGAAFSGTGTLTVGEDININAALNLPSSISLTLSSVLNIIGGAGSLSIDGTCTWNTGTIALPFTINSGASLSLVTSNTKLLSSTLTNNGTINWSAFNLGFNNGTLINNNLVIVSGANAFTHSAGTNSFVNGVTGTFSKITNAGATIFNIPVSNAGIIDIAAGTITSTTANATFSNSGTINFAPGTILNVSGTLAGGNSFNAGTNITGTGSLNLTTNSTINTAIVLPSTVLLTYSGNATTLGGTGSLAVNGTMNWGAGTLAVPTTINAGATLNLVTAGKALSTTLTNNGTIDWSASTINFNNGTLDNNGNFLITGTATNFTITSLTTNVFNNAGTITKTSAGTTGTGSVPFNNSGTINVSAGIFSKSGSNVIPFNNTGTINIEAGAVFNHSIGLAAGVFILDPGTVIAGSGSLVMLGNTTVNTALNIPFSITTDLGSATNNPTVSGTGSIMINGTLNWAQGVLSVPLTIAAGGTMNSTAAKMVSSTLTNNGTIVLTDPATGNVSVNNGTIINNGTITDNFAAARQFPSGGGANSFVNNGVYQKNNNVSITFNAGVPANNSTGVLGGVGTFIFNGGITNNGTIAPGGTSGIGLVSFGANSVNPPNTPTIQIHIQNGSGAGIGHDQLAMTGVTNISGANLVVTETPGAPFQSYVVMTAPAVNGFTGSFASTSLPAGYTLVIDNTVNPSTISVVKAPTGGSAPVFTFVPADVAVQCDAIPAVGNPTATDNCDGNVIITYNGQTITPGACADSYIITRSWTASDNCGNSTNASQTITVSDDTAPVFSFVPANTNAQCNALPAVGAPTASDNCDASVTITYNGETTAPGSSSDSYVITRTWTATDNCGNATVATQTITVTDDTAPVFSFVPANTNAQCNSIPAVGVPAATDNCDADVSITYDGQVITPGSCADSYTITRSWTATDNAGNTASASQVITVTDNTAPVFTFVPASATVQCDAIPALVAPVATDNCDADVTIIYHGEEFTPGSCEGSFTLTRTWTAMDNCGNTTNTHQILTVVDNTAPVFSFVPANTSAECNGGLPAVGTPTATDNCDNTVSIVYNGETTSAGACANSYTVTRTWTATDDCGNTAIATQLITVSDNTDPVFTFVPANTSAQCNTVPAVGTPTATDNCDNSVTITYNGQTTAPGAGSDYIITRTWTATDNCGNSTMASQTITVTDNTAPVFTFVPANTSAECQSIPAVGVPTATDNCDATVTITYNGQTITPGSCTDSYTITRSWTATDDAGNSMMASQTISVTDITAPVFTFVPASGTVQCNAIPAVVSPVASDNCDNSVTLVYHGEEFTPGSCAGSFTLTRTWTAIDNCGNATNTHQILTVVDTQAPVLGCPSNAVRSAVAGGCTYTAAGTEFNATATDGCSGATLGYVLSGATSGSGVTLAGVVFNAGVTTVTWTAVDGCNNSTSCSFTVTVNDATAPSIMCPSNIQQNANCTAVSISVPNPIVNDNCGVSTLTWSLTGTTTAASAASGINYVGTRNFNPGVTTVTYTVRDAAGNSSVCSFTVTVIGSSLPTITCPADITTSAFPLLCYGIVWDLGNPVTSGGCGGGQVTVSNDHPSSYYPVGTTYVTWTVKDANGNQVSCVQKVNVIDTQVPLLICPADKKVKTNAGQCYATGVNLGNPILTWDNCGVASITNNAPAQFPVGTTVVVWTVTDVNGNTSTCTQDVVVTDDSGPALTCPANISQTASGSCTKSIAVPNPVAADCGGITKLSWTMTGATTGSSPSGGINYVGTKTFNAGLTTVKYTASDANGNTTTCSFTVSLTGSGAPAIECPEDISQTAGSNCSKSIKVPNPTVSSSCGSMSTLTWTMSGATTGSSPSSGINYIGTRTFNVGTTIVTYTAKNASGSSTTCTFTVTITENQKPQIKCPSSILTLATGAGCSRSISIPNPTVSDNCSIASVTWTMTGATSGSSPATGINYVGTKTFNAGTTVVEYTVTDASGNERTCSFVVYILGICDRRVNNEYTMSRSQDENLITILEAQAYPNPSATGFNLLVVAPKSKEPVQIRVYDAVGRMVHQLKGMPEQPIRFGENFVAGNYIVEVAQGNERKTIKVIKR